MPRLHNGLMAAYFQEFLLVFIPLFVAIDAIGVLPVFWNLTSSLTKKERNVLITQASLTALAISVLFLFAGQALFQFLGINENDFRIAGGILLLIISIVDIAFGHPSSRKTEGERHIGVVPIGIPLIMGPAALTTILVQVDMRGYPVTLFAVVLNILIVWIMFRKTHLILKVTGEAGSRALGKVMALFLAAIAVMMIRVGLTGMLAP